MNNALGLGPRGTGCGMNRKKMIPLGGMSDLTVFIVAMCAFLILCPPLDMFLDHSDNCSPLAFVENLREGEVIYRDFLVQFPPGIYYLAYALMKVFDNNFLAYIVLICLGNALVSLFVFKIASELFGPVSATISCSFSVLLHPVMYKWYLCLFPLASLFFYLMYLKYSRDSSSGLGQLVISGILAGIGAYFRLDTAAYLLVAVLAGQLVRFYRRRIFGEELLKNGSEPPSRSILIHSAIFISSAGLTIVPFFEIGFCYGFLEAARQSLVVLTLTAPGALALPYPSLKVVPPAVEALLLRADLVHIFVVLFFAIPFVYLTYAAYIARGVVFCRSVESPLRFIQQVPIAVFGILLFLQATHRSDFAHLLQVATVFWIVLPGLLSRVWSGRLWPLALVFWLCVAIVVVSAVSADLSKRWAIETGIVAKLSGYYQGPDGVPDHPVSKLVDYVQANSGPRNRLLVVSHSVQIYYFAHRKFAGGLMYYQPWNREVYKKVLERLGDQRTQIDLVISLSDFSFDNMEQRSLKVFAPEVYEFIKRNFCCSAGIGPYVVLKQVLEVEGCSDIPNCRF